MPVCCCPGFPEQEGVLTTSLCTFCLYFLNRRRAKMGLRTAPGPFLPCMQCLGPAEGHSDLKTYSRWPASDCYAWSGPPEGAEGPPQDLELTP